MDHETPWPDGSLFTLALIGSELPICTTAVVGDTDTVIAATVMLMEADLDVSATEVALTVTIRSLGGGVLEAV
jgi:hypothetical protein